MFRIDIEELEKVAKVNRIPTAQEPKLIAVHSLEAVGGFLSKKLAARRGSHSQPSSDGMRICDCIDAVFGIPMIQSVEKRPGSPRF